MLYTSTTAGLYKSTDGAANWQRLNVNLPATSQIGQIVVTSSAPSTIYARQYLNDASVSANMREGILRSDDGGTTWTPITPPTTQGNSWQQIAVAPTSSSTVYAAGTRVGTSVLRLGVLKSTNAGASWTAAENGLPTDIGIRSLLVSPHDANVVLAGADGIYLSLDAGDNWTVASNGLPLEADGSRPHILTLAADPTNASTFYARTPTNLFKTVDRGASWQPAGMGLPATHWAYDMESIVVDPAAPATVYFSTPGSVYKSTDGGGAWTRMSLGLPTGAIWATLIVDPSNTNTLYVVASPLGVYKSQNAAGNWSAASRGIRAGLLSALAVSASQPAHVWAAIPAPSGLLQSQDRGLTWSLRAPNTLGLGKTIDAVAVHPTNPNVVYAGTSSGVYRSTDAGQSWTPSSNGIPTISPGLGPLIRALVIDPTTPTTLYAGGTHMGVYRSIDGGLTWTPSANLQTASVAALAIDQHAPSRLYAGGVGYFTSADSGSTWTQSGLSSITSLAVDPTLANASYAGGPDGVRRMWNAGASLTDLNTGLPPNPDVRALVVDSRDPRTLYAGTRLGVYWSRNGGESWSALVAGNAPSLVRAIAIDGAGGILYAATGGFGVFAVPLPDLTAPTVTPTMTVAATPTVTASPTITPTTAATMTPALCTPRPPVQMLVAATGDSRLRVTLTTGQRAGFLNELRTFKLGTLANATVEVVEVGPLQSGQKLWMPPGTVSIQLLVGQVTRGQAATVPITVTDGCGDWATTVGGGVAAFP